MTVSPPRRRWFRYSLRTLFVVLTLIGIWFGVQVKWIRDRQVYIAQNYATFTERLGLLPAKSQRTAPAPGMLWLFGVQGLKGIIILVRTHPGEELSNTDKELLDAAHRLFPEARVDVITEDDFRKTFHW